MLIICEARFIQATDQARVSRCRPRRISAVLFGRRL